MIVGLKLGVTERFDYKRTILKESFGGDGTVLCPDCGSGSMNP